MSHRTCAAGGSGTIKVKYCPQADYSSIQGAHSSVCCVAPVGFGGGEEDRLPRKPGERTGSRVLDCFLLKASV